MEFKFSIDVDLLFLQEEVQDLSMEEQRLDDEIRLCSFWCLVIPKLIVLYSTAFFSSFLFWLILLVHCREIQERLREMSEDEHNQK